MEKRNIIVMGASAGGFEALKTIMRGLPSKIEASIFIVWHMSPDVRGMLPEVLGRITTIPVTHAVDNEQIQTNHVYIAPPDHHLLVEAGHVRVTHGPKENRFRPAVDPLFRSAAFTYGNRVIGVILSGALDDGTAGLWTVKQYGGIAIVQDPKEAEVPSMPENARRGVAVDYTVRITELPELLLNLSSEKVEANKPMMSEDRKTEIEIKIAEEQNALALGIMDYGQITPYTCPECHGVLSKLTDGTLVRYRCHTGHAYSANSLLASLSEKIEDSLYNAMRGIEESVMMLNHLGDHSAEANNPKLAALYFQKAKEAETRALLVRQVIISNERLSKDSLRDAAEKLQLNGINKPADKKQEA